jgi:hypothetical protein
MASESSNTDQHLLQAKHANGDLFICDVADAVLKDLIPQMEHPFYSLSKKPETKIRRYEHNGNWLQIVPSVKGLATIYDKDILIYCVSQVMEKLKRNEPVGPPYPHHLLRPAVLHQSRHRREGLYRSLRSD